MGFQLPDDIREEFGVELTPAIKRKIMGENAARLYGIDIEAQRAKLANDDIGARLAGSQVRPVVSVKGRQRAMEGSKGITGWRLPLMRCWTSSALPGPSW